MLQKSHVPVLTHQVLEYLAPRPGGVYVDCTLGFAGHASEIARRIGAAGHLIGFDRDPQALAMAQQRLDALALELGPSMPRITLIGDPFSRIAAHLAPLSIDGILADFGVSSMQLDQPERGFSFQAEGPLDMRQDTRQPLTAEQVVNEMDEKLLANLIYEYGEERRSWRIARAIVRARPIATTSQLARVVAGCVPTIKSERIHPATRTFQALRIYVNRELDEIRDLLHAVPKLLRPEGRVVAISFHSLEDRIVKDEIRDGAAQQIWTALTRKPVTAGDEEIALNPRARSAKLRAAQRTEPSPTGTQKHRNSSKNSPREQNRWPAM